MAWSLCDRQDVTSIHPIAEASLQDDWSDMVEALIRQYMGEPYLGLVETITDEYHNGDGSSILRVRKPPIISVESLLINDVTVSASDYVVFYNYIQLKSEIFPADVLNVRVSYTSGTTDVDNVVRLTAVSMIIAIINYRNTWGSDSSLKWGSAEQKAGEKSPNYNVGLTSHLEKIMKRLLRRNRARVR